MLFRTFTYRSNEVYPLDVRKVIGSSPISSTMKETTPKGVVFLRFRGIVKRDTTCSGSGHRFESYIVHQRKNTIRKDGVFCFGMAFRYRTRRGRPSKAKAKKCPGDTFLARGRVLWIAECRRMPVGGDPFAKKPHLRVWFLLFID